MGFPTISLVSLAELKAELTIEGTGQDTALESLASRVTDMVERYLDRQIITRGNLTEYHTVPEGSAELWTLEWPLISVTTVHEDSERSYGSDALLVSGTDYIAVKPKGLIRRISSSSTGETEWDSSFRAVKVVYTAGYATTADVPWELKAIALQVAGLIWREVERRGHGVSSVSDATGNMTRFAAAGLTPAERSALAAWARWGHTSTGERDS